MKNIIRTSTLALAFIGGVGLVAAPALANSIHKEGRFGGSWSRIGPNDSYRHQRYSNRDYGPRYRTYRAPSYAYYGPRYGYYGQPYYDRGAYAPRAGFGISIR